MEERARYGAIDGLRAYAGIGILIMHVLANGDYDLSGFIFEKLIPSFTNLVFIFMIISSFSMCCGYYERMFSGGGISWEDFYKKRYIRVWPYFSMLCLLDLVITPSFNSLYEVFANLTLCFGFLSNAKIEVIGVGWFLGLIFVFYIIFPFFCVLLKNKHRAWLSFAVAYIFNWLCRIYYIETTRTNIIYCSVFLFAGGLIFLYKDKLSKLANQYKKYFLILCMMVTVIYFLGGERIDILLILYSLILIYSIGIKNKGLLLNRITVFLSKISLEIYLCHMVIYRGLEKLDLIHPFESELLSYFFTSVATFLGSIIFAKVTLWFIANGKNIVRTYISDKQKNQI